jgi:hypothetical protein
MLITSDRITPASPGRVTRLRRDLIASATIPPKLALNSDASEGGWRREWDSHHCWLFKTKNLPFELRRIKIGSNELRSSLGDDLKLAVGIPTTRARARRPSAPPAHATPASTCFVVPWAPSSL